EGRRLRLLPSLIPSLRPPWWRPLPTEPAPGEHPARLRAGRGPGLPLLRDRRARHGRRRAAGLPRRPSGPRHRPHRHGGRAAVVGGVAGPDPRTRPHSPAGRAAHRLPRRPFQHRRQVGRGSRPAGRSHRRARGVGPGLRQLLRGGPAAPAPPPCRPPGRLLGQRRRGGDQPLPALADQGAEHPGPRTADPGPAPAGPPRGHLADPHADPRRAPRRQAGARVDRRRRTTDGVAAGPGGGRHLHRPGGHAEERAADPRTLGM
ncbi:MAG: Glycerophosphoryl diester phosphodiesterase, partial [uncultured Friedmanniella sp.]